MAIPHRVSPACTTTTECWADCSLALASAIWPAPTTITAKAASEAANAANRPRRVNRIGGTVDGAVTRGARVATLEAGEVRAPREAAGRRVGTWVRCSCERDRVSAGARVGEAIGEPFFGGPNRTGVRSNACTISSTCSGKSTTFIEQVFDFVSRGAYLSNTRTGWMRGLTLDPQLDPIHSPGERNTDHHGRKRPRTPRCQAR